MPLRLGRIDYLNVWHIFHLLSQRLPEGEAMVHLPGHPSELNAALRQGRIDVSPSSSFEYLGGADAYCLLSGLGISARTQVQSVLLLSPVPRQELASWLHHHPGPILLSSASATASALLRILWHRAWQLPAVPWQTCPPGEGIRHGRPFLEIGNLALHHWVHPPDGWHIIDLASAWHKWTGLPFVFAVWIVRKASMETWRAALTQLHAALVDIAANLNGHLERLAPVAAALHGFPPHQVLQYWRTMHPTIGPEEMASLIRYSAYATELGLLAGTPTLRWFPS